MSASPIMVVLDTALGAITVALDADRAPLTVANFLRYLDGGFYGGSDRGEGGSGNEVGGAGGRFHRTVTPENQPDNPVRIEVIQAGPNPDRTSETGPPLTLERTTVTGLAHRDGTISMARFAPDSAVADFFICIGDQPELDFGGARYPDGQGFAAFGQVSDGMDVVRRIQRAPAEAQRLTPPITFRAARRG